jgi:enoyl-CoA hydratase/carnithine racemase
MQNAPVLVAREDGIAVLTLNAPDRLNAISTEMRTELRDALRRLLDDDSCRAIVLTGAGKSFSSGADVGQMQSGSTADIAHVRMRYKILHEAVHLMVTGGKPVIAAVEGHAFGAGLSLAMASDFVVVGRGAKLGAAFGKVGLVADCGLLWTLPQRIGMARTKDFVFGMGVMGAEQAVSMGMADELVETGTALAAARARALAYGRGAPLAMAAAKSLLSRSFDTFQEFLETEGDAQERLVVTFDHDEGRKAFAEKRAPQFRGR